MTETRKRPGPPDHLRNQAEDQIRGNAPSRENLETSPPDRLEQTLHELRVHQVELEIQNEELRLAQVELDAARARYFDLFDLAPIGYCTLNEQGVILEANLTAANLLGMPRGALVGQRISHFILPADQDIYSQHRKRLQETGQLQMCDLRMLKQDRSPFWAQLKVSGANAEGDVPLLRIMLSDISERKVAEEALATAAFLQKAIFNSTHFLSIATDAKGLIQVFNVGAERMLGYPAVDVVNKLSPSDLTDPGEVIAHAKALAEAFQTPVSPGFEALAFKASRGLEDICEFTFLCKDGKRFPAAMSVSALRDAKGTIIGYLLMGTDNTARKRIEAEREIHDLAIENKNAELQIAMLTAEKANLAKSVFLSSMSHELRTPLNAILGFAQLLDCGKPTPTPDQKASIDHILKAGWYLLDLVNEILDLAKIDAGKVSMSLEPTPLVGILRDCQDMVRGQAGKRGIKLAFPEFKTPCSVHADPTRLKQILANLLSNAIKFNRVGGAVEVSCAVPTPGRLRIAVRDTGAGLTPEQISQLFQPFNRLGQKENIVEGTGVGLVVAKRLIELMGGAIGVESTVGQGSVFWIELDTVDAPPKADPKLAPLGPVQMQPPTASALKTVLYVEDNPANLALVQGILSRRPEVQLLCATDGHSGIEIARASLPDMILMDISLPGMSGIEALENLAAHPVTAHIPVVAISAHASPQDIEKALKAGFFQYLTKPIKIPEFLKTLDAALNLPESAPTAKPKHRKCEGSNSGKLADPYKN